MADTPNADLYDEQQLQYYYDADRLTLDQVRDLQGLDDSEVERLKKQDDVMRRQRGGQLEFPALQFDP
ncbi:hypothetical protein [Histidinibacterium aquaticum]|uniref:Uncharacterized protein n=1 Tax=Histidinibacterium aquaticum TaxID=2613962 RepID=A0A5J5GC37_9RHOB|nr:hypothetical protein [Histidinibacterium aquaticum]KAA9005004.1 hypothetical protein F3S47_19060 [Histidinibacterium aquaticum]